MLKCNSSILLSTLLAKVGCDNQEAANAQLEKHSTIVESVSKQVNDSLAIVKNPARNADQFVKVIRSSGYTGDVRVETDYLLVEQDTVYFPDDLELGKRYEFKSIKGNRNYSLAVERISLTVLNFNYKLHDNGTVVYEQRGKATLSPLFFLASEVDEDDLTGDAYGANEYVMKAKDCWFNIRIGMGRDDEGRLRATINQSCPEGNSATSAPEMITLRTE